MERWPGQAELLAEMATASGIEGFEVEYWSPSPGWKSTGAYINGTLKGYDAATLGSFAEAVVDDAKYLEANGMTVALWGLQNEPPVGPDNCIYSCCGYDAPQYYAAFNATAKALRAALPNAAIHVSSESGPHYSPQLIADPFTLSFVDLWTYHCVGCDSDSQIEKAGYYNNATSGKPVANNEYEYLGGPASPVRMVNTAQTIMNWLAFEDSPTFFWLHALKPLGHSEASGYGLGFWNPPLNPAPPGKGVPPPGFWDFNQLNFNSLAGFTSYMPFDAVRVNVEEDVVRPDVRVLAYLFDPAKARWLLPHGSPPLPVPAKGSTRRVLAGEEAETARLRASATKLAFVLTNRWQVTPVAATVSLANVVRGTTLSFTGHQFTPNVTDGALGTVTAMRNPVTGVPFVAVAVEPLSIQFWVQD